jgi:hypothetical protein
MMKYKIGQDLYRPYADGETGKIELDIYKVRTIRGGIVYAVLFSKGFTWVRLSTKTGDYGWGKNIPGYCRERARDGEPFRSLFTTSRQALMAIKKDVTKNEHGVYSPDIKKKILTTIKGQLTRLKL